MLYLAFAVAVVAVAGSRTGSVLATVLVSLVVLAMLPLLGIVEAVGRWLPSHLVGALTGLVSGDGAGDYLPAALVTPAVTAVLLWLAVRMSGAREA